MTVVRSYFYSNTPDDINSNDDNSNFASTCCGGGACDADAHCSQISSDNFKGSGGKPYSCNCPGEWVDEPVLDEAALYGDADGRGSELVVRTNPILDRFGDACH